MVVPTTWLPQLYQRFQLFWDRAVPAAGLALLLWASSEATGAYPSEWRLFLSAFLFLVGLAWPWVAYAAFTFLIAYPLYRISIYVAAILLAALILTAHWAMRNLGAAVLVLITPALLPWHLEATVPLLAGLWWGELAGTLAGGLAALWLKLLAGMAGQPLDLARLSGQTLAGTDIVTRFSGFNSLQTLLGLVNPFADTSRALLLHLLQVLTWALCGYIAGRLVQRVWTDRLRSWAPLLSAVPAGGVLWASYVLLPGMLKQPQADLSGRLDNPMLWSFASALVAAAIRRFYLYLRRPLFRPLRRRPQRAPSSRLVEGSSRSAASLPEGRERFPERGSAKPAFNGKTTKRSRPAAETDDDIIMLEID